MNKKPKKSPYSWPFSYYRQTWIADADKLADEACEAVGEIPENYITPKTCRTLRRSAKKLCKAADLYKNAGLGLLAAESWRSAAGLYGRIGDRNLRDHVLELADNVENQDV